MHGFFDFRLHTSIQARTIPIIWPSFLSFLVVDVLARLRTSRMRPVDLSIPESELRWSNISDPFGFSLPCQLPVTFRARGKCMDGVAGLGFRIESKNSPVKIYEYGNFADTIIGGQSGFFVSVIDAVDSKADQSYWECESSNAWETERHAWTRRPEGFPADPERLESDSGNEED